MVYVKECVVCECGYGWCCGGVGVLVGLDVGGCVGLDVWCSEGGCVSKAGMDVVGDSDYRIDNAVGEIDLVNLIISFTADYGFIRCRFSMSVWWWLSA